MEIHVIEELICPGRQVRLFLSGGHVVEGAFEEIICWDATSTQIIKLNLGPAGARGKARMFGYYAASSIVGIDIEHG